MQELEHPENLFSSLTSANLPAHPPAMSVQQALMFIAVMRREATLRSALLASQEELDLHDLCALARGRGLFFDATHLQMAFRSDWALRALRRQRETARAPD